MLFCFCVISRVFHTVARAPLGELDRNAVFLILKYRPIRQWSPPSDGYIERLPWLRWRSQMIWTNVDSWSSNGGYPYRCSNWVVWQHVSSGQKTVGQSGAYCARNDWMGTPTPSGNQYVLKDPSHPASNNRVNFRPPHKRLRGIKTRKSRFQNSTYPKAACLLPPLHLQAIGWFLYNCEKWQML